MVQRKSENTFEKIYLIVKTIPSGKVATYGQIAAMIGPGLPARIVGFALNGLGHDNDIPWHRVINSKGTVSYSATRNNHDSLQRLLLEKEGVEFNSSGQIDLKKYLWQPGGLNK